MMISRPVSGSPFADGNFGEKRSLICNVELFDRMGTMRGLEAVIAAAQKPCRLSRGNDKNRQEPA